MREKSKSIFVAVLAPGRGCVDLGRISLVIISLQGGRTAGGEGAHSAPVGKPTVTTWTLHCQHSVQAREEDDQQDITYGQFTYSWIWISTGGHKESSKSINSHYRCQVT